jgi:predicted O-methyltransferase YrrM
MTPAIEYVLRSIEKQERSWSYQLSEKEEALHSFGRIPEDGRTIGFWSVPRQTGELLAFFAKAVNAKMILELGCSAGYSTLFLAEAALQNDGHVYTTEILKQKIGIARANFQEAGVADRITLIEGEIRETLRGWNTNVVPDLVFLDADKERYGEYFEALMRIMKPGGLIIADNASCALLQDGTRVRCEIMRPFLETVRNDSRVSVFLLEIDNGLLFMKRR